MKKYLVRAKMTPFEVIEPEEIIGKNIIGANLGNLIFSQSVFANLMKEDTQLDIIYDFKSLGESDIKRIDSEYDAFIIPLANAFRATFIDEMVAITNLVNKLTIPCVVVGVGVQAGFKTDMMKMTELNKVVKNFMDAVLKKSSLVGVRGKYTGEYLKKLGYEEEKDFTVIGCPSMFMHGKHLPKIEKKPLTPESKVSFNCKIHITKELHEFMERTIPLFKNYCYIPQIRDEMSLMYWNMPLSPKKYPNIPDYYPHSLKSQAYAKDKSRMFVDATSWMNFLSTRDVSIGTRIHGNITAIQSGTPAYIIASDERVKELAEYHNIPHSLVKDIPKDKTIFDLYNEADYSQLYVGHEERFRHYLDFLEKNKIEHIYDENLEPTTNIFWEKLSECKFIGEIHSFATVSRKERKKRLRLRKKYYRFSFKKEFKIFNDISVKVTIKKTASKK